MNKQILLLCMVTGTVSCYGVGGSPVTIYNGAAMPVAVAIVQVDAKTKTLVPPSQKDGPRGTMYLIESNKFTQLQRPSYARGLDTFLIYDYNTNELAEKIRHNPAVMEKRFFFAAIPEKQAFKLGQMGNKDLIIAEVGGGLQVYSSLAAARKAVPQLPAKLPAKNLVAPLLIQEIAFPERGSDSDAITVRGGQREKIATIKLESALNRAIMQVERAEKQKVMSEAAYCKWVQGLFTTLNRDTGRFQDVLQNVSCDGLTEQFLDTLKNIPAQQNIDGAFQEGSRERIVLQRIIDKLVALAEKVKQVRVKEPSKPISTTPSPKPVPGKAAAQAKERPLYKALELSLKLIQRKEALQPFSDQEYCDFVESIFASLNEKGLGYQLGEKCNAGRFVAGLDNVIMHYETMSQASGSENPDELELLRKLVEKLKELAKKVQKQEVPKQPAQGADSSELLVAIVDATNRVDKLLTAQPVPSWQQYCELFTSLREQNQLQWWLKGIECERGKEFTKKLEFAVTTLRLRAQNPKIPKQAEDESFNTLVKKLILLAEKVRKGGVNVPIPQAEATEEWFKEASNRLKTVQLSDSWDDDSVKVLVLAFETVEKIRQKSPVDHVPRGNKEFEELYKKVSEGIKRQLDELIQKAYSDVRSAAQNAYLEGYKAKLDAHKVDISDIQKFAKNELDIEAATRHVTWLTWTILSGSCSEGTLMVSANSFPGKYRKLWGHEPKYDVVKITKDYCALIAPVIKDYKKRKSELEALGSEVQSSKMPEKTSVLREPQVAKIEPEVPKAKSPTASVAVAGGALSTLKSVADAPMLYKQGINKASAQKLVETIKVLTELADSAERNDELYKSISLSTKKFADKFILKAMREILDAGKNATLIKYRNQLQEGEDRVTEEVMAEFLKIAPSVEQARSFVHIVLSPNGSCRAGTIVTDAQVWETEKYKKLWGDRPPADLGDFARKYCERIGRVVGHYTRKNLQPSPATV